MSYPVPTPDALADTQASELEYRLRVAPDGTVRVIDARSPRSTLAGLARSNAMALFASHLHLRWIADQFMPDTATDWLDRHGAIWGVPRRAATIAVGSVRFTGPAGTVLPSGIGMTLSGAQWITTAGATIPVGGEVVVTVAALTAGIAGNVAAGTALALVSPITALPLQQAVTEPGGISGGADIEDLEAWRTRILQEIREPAHGGAYFDYERWTVEAIAPARVTCIRNWVGAGSVAVAFLMPDGLGGIRVPTAPEIAVVDAYIKARAPVTAEVYTLAGTLRTVNVTVAVNPNSAAAIAAVTAIIPAYFDRVNPDKTFELDLGSTLYLSRLREAISEGSGENYHQLSLPAADVVAGPLEMLRPGVITVVGI